jgi:N-acetyltransferase 10
LNEENAYLNEAEKELNTLKASFKDKPPVGNLIGECKTLDQAKCVLSMIDSISEKMSKATVSITAGRGRVNKMIDF